MSEIGLEFAKEARMMSGSSGSVVEETNGFDIIIDDGSHHCRPVKQAVSADKGMILRAILAN
jgi:hypothetical protein